MQCVSCGVMDGGALCAEREQRREERQDIAAVRAQKSRQAVRERIGRRIKTEIGGAAEEVLAARRMFLDYPHVDGGDVLSSGAESLPRSQSSAPRLNAERGCEVVGTACGNYEQRKFAVDDRRKVAMNGAITAEDDGYIGARGVICPRDGLVCLKRTQMRLSSMRSDDSDGAQSGAGYCIRRQRSLQK